MRIWSIHPKYLDQRGLVALWRETLLARNVLLGNTKGYTNHPQLERFKFLPNPILGIDTYLYFVYQESLERGYSFNKEKFSEIDEDLKIEISIGQLEYEFKHLLGKLKVRDKRLYEDIKGTKEVLPHPMFNVMEGDIADWERI